MGKHLIEDGTEDAERLPQQVILFLLHSLLALAAWFAMMLVGYAINPPAVPQSAVFALSVLIPLIVGYLVTRLRSDGMAAHVWLAGITWFLILCLWILDMPTGPNTCMNCSATEKLARTLFSFPRPSGLIDNNGPFFGTWPVAALFGYSIGAHLVLRRRR